MLSDYLIAPSLNSLLITGILIIVIIITIIYNFRELLKLPIYQKLSLHCIISIAFGSHGLMHLGVEKQYNFNLYKWIKF